MAKPKFTNNQPAAIMQAADFEASALPGIRLVLSRSVKRVDCVTIIDGAPYLLCIYRQKDNVVRCDIKPAE